LALMGGFTLVALLAAADLVSDLDEGVTLTHVGLEACLLATGFVGAILVAQRLISARRAAQDARQLVANLEKRLEETKAEAARWRDESRELLGGLGQALDRQFERWGLSPAEKEVALLLLKGLTHKEIADIRAVSEATARQQARAVYKKGGLSGRHDLAAFFLEDLLLPTDRRNVP